MVFKKEILLKELEELVVAHQDFVIKLQAYPKETLTFKENKKKWSVIECIAHLNLYGTLYLKEISTVISIAKNTSEDVFKSGYLGNKFAMDMLPKEGMRRINTFKSKNPIYAKINTEAVIRDFINQQQQLTQLLYLSKNKSLTNLTVKTTLPLIKFSLGDTFRFVINHNQRHIVQAINLLK